MVAMGDESDRHPDQVHRDMEDLVDTHVTNILCHLHKLSWIQTEYQCERDMENHPITEKFISMSRARSKKYYRDYVVLQVVKRALYKLQWVIRYPLEMQQQESESQIQQATPKDFPRGLFTISGSDSLPSGRHDRRRRHHRGRRDRRRGGRRNNRRNNRRNERRGNGRRN